MHHTVKNPKAVLPEEYQGCWNLCLLVFQRNYFWYSFIIANERIVLKFHKKKRSKRILNIDFVIFPHAKFVYEKLCIFSFKKKHLFLIVLIENESSPMYSSASTTENPFAIQQDLLCALPKKGEQNKKDQSEVFFHKS